MKIAFDVDGCLANFTDSYAAKLVKVTGTNLLPKPLTIPCWDWDKHYGYSQDQIAATIENVAADKLFWQKLDTLAEPEVFTRINSLSKDNEVYFLTNRFGSNAKQQTEKWLYEQGILYPTVIIGSNKRPILDTIKVTFFVDDKLETMNELGARPNFYLIETTYNQTGRISGLATASSVKDALQKAGLW
jgi:hypothetical protein